MLTRFLCQHGLLGASPQGAEARPGQPRMPGTTGPARTEGPLASAGLSPPGRSPCPMPSRVPGVPGAPLCTGLPASGTSASEPAVGLVLRGPTSGASDSEVKRGPGHLHVWQGHRASQTHAEQNGTGPKSLRKTGTETPCPRLQLICCRTGDLGRGRGSQVPLVPSRAWWGFPPEGTRVGSGAVPCG